MTRGDYLLPFADPVIVHVLATHPDLAPHFADRVSTTLSPVTPCIRVAGTGDVRLDRWERAAVWQVEVWSSDPVEAGTLATLVANVLPDVRDLRLPDLGAYVSGAWIETAPRALPTDDTDLARYILEVGLILHAAIT